MWIRIFIFSSLLIDIYRRDLTANCDEDDVPPPNRVNTTERLSSLRERMRNYGVHAYYIPMDEVGRRTWISGFSGSNGDVIVTSDQVRIERGFQKQLMNELLTGFSMD